MEQKISGAKRPRRTLKMGNESLPRRLHGLISPFSLFWGKIGRFLVKIYVEKNLSKNMSNLGGVI